MGDPNSADLKTLENRPTSSSMDDVERKMLLLKIAENEKSHFDDEMNWNDWNETENSVTQSIEEMTKRSIPEEWIDEYPKASSPISSLPQPIQSAPHSYYELMDLNGEQVENTIRMARVPSQYQLDALSEMFIYDVPQNYLVRPTDNCHLNPTISVDQDNIPNEWTTPYFVNSEYVSELLM